MIRLFQLALIIATAWLIARLIKDALKQSSRRTAKAPPPQTLAKNMVPCNHCGMHIPETEALADHGRYYCSRAHRDAHREKHQSGG